MPMHALPDDYYDYQEATESLQGRHTGRLFTSGNEIKVKITEVTAIAGGILLDWVEGGTINTQNREKCSGHQRRNASTASRKNKAKPRTGRTKRR
jgi:DNA-directed RNA polymerase subunit E'/Rpb7